MDKIYYHLKQHPLTFLAVILYLICWISLFSRSEILHPVIIGEWTVAPVISMPFCLMILLNALFKKGHRLFYLIMAFIVIFPFIILILLAWFLINKELINRPLSRGSGLFHMAGGGLFNSDNAHKVSEQQFEYLLPYK